jgi:hypothetical protein
MNTLIKLLTDEDGEAIEEPRWCLADPCAADASRVLCCGSTYGYGESSVKYETKEIKRGGIECPACLRILNIYKGVKL